MDDLRKPQPKDTPDLLYKYRYFDLEGNHLKIIEDGQLWFTSARDFNDPFDSALQFQFDGNRELKMKWAKKIAKIEYPKANHNERRKYVNEVLRNLRKDEYINLAQNQYVEDNYQNFGICSLTPIKDNLLMWAHYSDDHKGFCVGLSSKEILKIQDKLAYFRKIVLQLVKVEYSQQIPAINFFESMLSNHGEKDIMKLLTMKSSHWKYENEYRLMLWDKIDTTVDIGHNSIVEIILGCRIEEDNKQKMLDLLDEKSIKAAVYQAHKHKFNFALEFEKIR